MKRQRIRRTVEAELQAEAAAAEADAAAAGDDGYDNGKTERLRVVSDREHALKGLFLILIAVVGAGTALYIWRDGLASHYRGESPHLRPEGGSRVWTKAELAAHDGSNPDSPIYLALIGQVFDVTKGSKFYAKPDGGYAFFSGRDASLAFVTGNFGEHLTDDVSSLTDAQLVSLSEWLEFYHKDYHYIGLLEGNFYDRAGNPTAALDALREGLARGKASAAARTNLNVEFPPCNVRRASGERGELWCTELSGGIQRAWVGRPRELFDQRSNERRCACVQGSQLRDPRLREYPGCASDSVVCWVD